MQPDFSKKTVNTLDQRAGYLCSNPDCRKATAGPNSDPTKATIVGEAAHIHGARPSSKRFLQEMNDATRAEITNAIWLCKVCHKKIDADEEQYPSELLFSWRERHEHFVASELGSESDKIESDILESKLSMFDSYPHIIKRIAKDKPEAWEWRLTSELLRFLNGPVLRKIEDLHGGLYFKQLTHVPEEDMWDWIQDKLQSAIALMQPFEGIIKTLNDSWGPHGRDGDINEIHHSCCLIKDYLEQVVLYEERIYFASVPDEFASLQDMLKHALGSQALKLKTLPDTVDKALMLMHTDHGGAAENPYIHQASIDIVLPENWSEKFNQEMERAFQRTVPQVQSDKKGCWTYIFSGLILFLILIVLR